MVSVYKRPESPFYQARIVVGGRARRISTQEKTRAGAERYARQREEEENELLKSSSSISLVQAYGMMQQENDLRPKTLESYEGSFKNVYQTLGDFSFGALTPEMVEGYIAERLKVYAARNEKRREEVEAKLAEGKNAVFRRVSGRTQIGHDLRFLSSLFRQAGQWDVSIRRKPNPVALVEDKKKFKPGVRKGFLSQDQFQTLLDGCKQAYQRTFLLLCIDTGMRKSEMLGLRWDEIDLNGKCILIGNVDKTRTKTGEARRVPLTARLRDTLRDTLVTQRREGENTLFVFPGRLKKGEADRPITTFKTFWTRIRTEAGLPDVTIHFLRHTHASWAIQKGVGLMAVKEILGHASISTTQRYAKESNDSLNAAIERFEKHTELHTRDTRPSD